MIRRCVLLVVPLLVASAGPRAMADEVISRSLAASHGLCRAWSLQVELDRSRSQVQSVILDRGVVFVQSDAAVVHAFDAETGRPIWNGARVVGDPRRPTLPPAVSKNMMAVVNGSDLYVLNRQNGELLWKTEVDGVPAMAPSMTDENLLVPTINGRVLVYRLKPYEEPDARSKPMLRSKDKAAQAAIAAAADSGVKVLRLAERQPAPLFCQSPGQLTGPPAMLSQSEDEDLVGWTTDQGVLYIAAIERGTRFTLRHRFLAGSGTAAGLAFRPAEGNTSADTGLVYVASREGLVYAVSDKTGQSVWEFPVGEAVSEAPALVGENLYVATQLGGIYCLDAKTGVLRWSAPQVVQLLAALPERFYGVDKLDRLVTLDAATGSRLDAMAIHGFPIRLANTKSDRIILASRQGLLQCLHDPRHTQALVYATEPEQPVKRAEKAKPAAHKPAEHAAAQPAPGGGGGFMEAKPEAPAGAFGAAVEEKPKAAKKAKEPEAGADPFATPAKKAK